MKQRRQEEVSGACLQLFPGETPARREEKRCRDSDDLVHAVYKAGDEAEELFSADPGCGETS